MDPIFSAANSVWNLFKNLLAPETYSQVLEGGWLPGLGLVLSVTLFLVINRKKKIEKRRQLEELENALLDDDDEAHALDLPESLSPEELYADYPDDDFDSAEQEDLESVPEPLRRTLARDPEFGGQIVISAQSSRKQNTNQNEDEGTESGLDDAEPAGTPADIEEEFARFAEELKKKQREVQLRHRLEEDLFEESHYQEETQGSAQEGPISLSLSDMIEEDPLDWNQELDELLENPAASTEEEVSNADLLAEAGEERRRKNERIIQRLEEFEKDLEHRFQAGRLSKLAQKNFELVESLKDSEQAREYQEMKRRQSDSLAALENMVFGPGKPGKKKK